MEYKQFSDIKGIFKNFFHKKEDFNNKGLISKKENFNTSKTAYTAFTLAVLYLITTVIYVWSVWSVGLLPKWAQDRRGWALAGGAFLYVSILLVGQIIYYYYLGGEEEISEMLKDNKWAVGPFVGYSIVIVLTFFIRLILYRGDFWKALGWPANAQIPQRQGGFREGSSVSPLPDSLTPPTAQQSARPAPPLI
jgi:hypothetical protein